MFAMYFFFRSLFFFNLYLFLAVLGLRFCVRAFSSCGRRGPLFIAVRGPLTIAASLVAEHRLQTHRLSSCGSRAQLLCGMWDLPRPGLEPVSPALAGRFSTTAPPGKPCRYFLIPSLAVCCSLLQTPGGQDPGPDTPWLCNIGHRTSLSFLRLILLISKMKQMDCFTLSLSGFNLLETVPKH